MKNLFTDPCEVKYWNGEIKQYGVDDAQFRIEFIEPIAKSEIINDPSLAFGEGYMFSKFDIVGSVQKVLESINNNPESIMNQKSHKIEHLTEL